MFSLVIFVMHCADVQKFFMAALQGSITPQQQQQSKNNICCCHWSNNDGQWSVILISVSTLCFCLRSFQFVSLFCVFCYDYTLSDDLQASIHQSHVCPTRLYVMLYIKRELSGIWVFVKDTSVTDLLFYFYIMFLTAQCGLCFEFILICKMNILRFNKTKSEVKSCLRVEFVLLQQSLLSSPENETTRGPALHADPSEDLFNAVRFC